MPKGLRSRHDHAMLDAAIKILSSVGDLLLSKDGPKAERGVEDEEKDDDERPKKHFLACGAEAYDWSSHPRAKPRSVMDIQSCLGCRT